MSMSYDERRNATLGRLESADDTCEGYGPADTPTCSMCGAATHTERERTDDGEWDEDCVFHPFFDGDGRDLRRPGQAGRWRSY